MRLVLDYRASYASQWEAVKSIASEIGCTAETLRVCVRQHECDTGQRPSLSSQERQRIKALECEVRGLRQANDLLCKASAFFPRRSSTAGKSHEGVYDAQRGRYESEPICKVLPIAPSTYY